MKLVVALLIFSFGVLAAPKVSMETSMGNIEIELNDKKAPITVKNFLQYANDGHYNGLIFHRVISNFMIQGGGHKPDMSEKSTKDPIQNEANNGLSNEAGTIAMARMPSPHSATAQFFINVVDNKNLDYQSPGNFGYCVFGKVTKGMDVVNKIKMVKVGNKGMHRNVPVDPVIIKKVTVLK